MDPLKIVLHGALVYDLVDVLRLRLAAPAEVARLLGTEPAREQEQVLRDADVAIAMTTHGLALPPGLRLLQVPGAGLDLVQLDLVPPGAFVCNAYGHDIAGGWIFSNEGSERSALIFCPVMWPLFLKQRCFNHG